MSNFFLLNDAIDLSNFDDFKTGMSEIVAIERENNDCFLKHDSVWNLDVISTLYSTYDLTEKAIGYFLESLSSQNIYFDNESSLDTNFPGVLNGFLGIDFSNTNISSQKQIINNSTYKKLLDDDLWNITFRNLWDKREKLFPNLIFCGEVQNQISLLGNSSQLNQIISRLTDFNKVIKLWTSGEFSYNMINNNSSLRISPESKSTMNKFGNERLFKLPNGNTEYFTLHIKTGDFRFHFYPDNQNRKVFIGYIGTHLTTISN